MITHSTFAFGWGGALILRGTAGAKQTKAFSPHFDVAVFCGLGSCAAKHFGWPSKT